MTAADDPPQPPEPGHDPEPAPEPPPLPPEPGRRPFAFLLAALRYAAEKHRDQRRKGENGVPYLHHCIEVADVLARVGGVEDAEVLAAALLHDTLEDTDATAPELERRFGARVRALVEAVSDDPAQTREQRRALQVERAPGLSRDAQRIKLADKICNVRDVIHAPPAGWSRERRLDYVEWTARVVLGCGGASAPLEAAYARLLEEARRVLTDAG